MDKDLTAFYKTLELNSLKDTFLPEWVAEVAFACINENNVKEVLKILAKADGGANHEFWSMVNKAPTTEEGWDKIMYIVGGESSERYKASQKRVVELVRSTINPTQQKINDLFK